MRRRGVGAKLVVLVACIAGALGPFACGGDAFTTASGDGGALTDASLEGSSGDSMAGDGAIGIEAAPPVEAGGVTLTGNVVDPYFLPLSGVAVHCQGQSATTASDGTFTLTGITAPYAITAVVDAPNSHKHAYVFEGASRRSPTLQLVAEQAQTTQTATLNGGLYSHTPNTAGIVFADFPLATPTVATPSIAIAEGASSYSGGLSWVGNASASATLYALQWLVLNGAPSGYVAYATTQQTLSNGGIASWTVPPSFGIPQGSMTVTVTPPPGYLPLDIGVFFRPPGSGVAAEIQHGFPGGTNTAAVVTPNVMGGTLAACGLQVPEGVDAGPNTPYGYACKTGLGANDSPTLQPPPANLFVSPPSTASVGTTFAYQATPSAVNLVIFTTSGSSGPTGDILVIVTADAQVQVPDLSALGVAFPQGAVITAAVYALAPFAGIDTALGATGYAERLTDLRFGTAPVTDGEIAYSGVVAFTAQ
jgi:hypothetical protein